MNQLEYQRELAAFDEKISLAELEESKAAERVKELRYERSRFIFEFTKALLKVQAQQEQQEQPREEKPDAGRSE